MTETNSYHGSFTACSLSFFQLKPCTYRQIYPFLGKQSDNRKFVFGFYNNVFPPLPIYQHIRY